MTGSMYYEFRINGSLDPARSNWFSGLEISIINNETLLTGPVLDQAELFGILKKIRDMGIPLISVNPVNSD